MPRIKHIFEKLPSSVELCRLGNNDIVLQLRKHLLRENVDESVAGIYEIFKRAALNHEVCGSHLMVAEMLCSTFRSTRFSNQVLAMLPPERAGSIRARVMVEYIHFFTLDEIKGSTADCIAMLLALPTALNSALARLVLNGGDDTFFFLIDNLEGFNFNFGLHNLMWMSDPSDYACDPGLNPAHLQQKEGANFMDLVLGMGTSRMKRWAASRLRPGTGHYEMRAEL